METYSTREVLAATGITVRQINTWCYSGLILGQPRKVGYGAHRTWTRDDVARVVEIRDAINAATAILDAAGLPGHSSLIGGSRQTGRIRAIPGVSGNRMGSPGTSPSGEPDPAESLSAPLKGIPA